MRRKSRILAMQTLFAWDVSGKNNIDDFFNFDWIKKYKPQEEEIIDFAKSIIIGTVDNIEEIDQKIKMHLNNWTIDRLKKVDLAILRISLYALLYQKDIDVSISINEAVELAKEFGTEDSYKFVNAVLDNIIKLDEKK